MKKVIAFLAILFFLGCKSNKLNKDTECSEYSYLLQEFASKFDSADQDCLKFHFEKDAKKFERYSKSDFMHFRHNEIFYYQHNLTNFYSDLSEKSKKCLTDLSKNDIVKLFGESFSFNEHYLSLSYRVCKPDNREEINFNVLEFKFSPDDKLKTMFINIYQVEP